MTETDELSEALAEIQALYREIDQWKANHDQQVTLKRKLHGMYTDTRAQLDRHKRYVNRFDAAIAHHKHDCEANDVPDTHDEALWAARDRIIKDSAATTG